ncbi:MAG TPA: sulfatase-like hydrolase/transferase, partial [Gemmatales bacterium]|nr:sulfatase-like hydrolase/transferase [Gemmatales bacterium]
PGTGYYSSTAIASHAIKCLQDHARHHAEKPFFSFLAFTAPHFPVQAPAEDIARYRDVYDQGWESLRERRWQKLQQLLPGASLTAFERSIGPPYHLPQAFDKLGPGEVNRPHPWGTLTEEQRRFQARKMAVHAAMVDRMDQEIGRVVEQLKNMNALENTLIIFLSDNGATAEIMVRGDGHDRQAESGSGATFLSIGPGWSSLCNTPFRRHKTWVHEGGIATPCIVHWPQGLRSPGELRHTPAHVIDIVPTVLALAGSQAPSVWQGEPVPPSPGRSLLPAFESEAVIARDHLWWLHENNRALRQGNWKIVAAGKEAPWELYDLSQDRCETKNLAATHPDKVQELEAIWKRELAAMQELVQRP